MIKKIFIPLLLCAAMCACSNNKNLAQSAMSSSDSLIQSINSSKPDTEALSPLFTKLQKENDLIIAFAKLNYAWARKGTYYVLAGKNDTWKMYVFTSKLPPATDETVTSLSPVKISQDSAKQIAALYSASELWQTEGNTDGDECEGKGGCNINDAETWTISAGTDKIMHTTTYYAPEFFEECCPGNRLRTRFIAIAKQLQKLAGNQSSAPDR